MRSVLIVLVLLVVVLARDARAATSVWTDVAAGEMDERLLTPRAEGLLRDPEIKWKHAQTDRFVMHFENGIFAAKVARMGEFFYTYIATNLPGVRDSVPGRSHIFIFRDPKDWRRFLASHGEGVEAWAFSYVEGHAMYLQQAGDLQSSASTLGHEMTHLVMNRLLPKRLPLWLSEGLAEWYGEFAYAAYKGIKKSRRAEFQELPARTNLASVLAAREYPEDPQAFYRLSKYMVGFLRIERPDVFGAFLRDAGEGDEVPSALQEHYGFADAAAFEEAFWKFAR